MKSFGTADVRTFGTLFGPTATGPHLFGDFGQAIVYTPIMDFTATRVLSSGAASTLSADIGVVITRVVDDGHTTTVEN
jgi:hypothetical protein